MKNKASLILAEQLVMILVFSLAAVICLGIFIKAHQISQQSENLDAAVLLAQNAAETVKASRGDWEVIAEKLNGTSESNGVSILYNRDLQPEENGFFSVHIRSLPTENLFLGSAEISVYCSTEPDSSLFTLAVAWQEVA